MTLTVEAHGLTKRYGALRAVGDVSFAIPGGSIVGLLGRNGAGKTTLMQLITGQELATTGEVRVLGENPVENPRVMSTLCFVKEAQKYPEDFRVRHVMSVAPRFFPNWDAEYAERLIDEFRLTRKQRIKKLSRGQLSSVGIIVGLASRAPVTIFDEPYLGLDAIARQNFYDHLLADYSDNPRTIILSTHLIDEVANLLEHAIVIDDGRIVLDAPVDELRASAVTVSGPASAVDTLLTGREVMHHQTLGGLATATVAALSEAERASAAGEGLEVGPVSLQQLIIRRSGGWTTANVVAWPLGVLAFILLLNIGIGIVIEQATQSAADSGGEADVTITVSGGVAFVYIYMLVIAVQSVNMSFSIALGWGATRRDFALGTLAFFGIMSLSYGLLIAAMAVVERVTGGWGRRLQFFGDPQFGLDEFGPAFLFSFLLLLLFMSIGGSIAAVYVRWRATGMYVFWAALAVAAVGGAALIGYTDNWGTIGRFFVDAGVLGTALWSLVITALATLTLYLVLRWATPRD